MKKLNKVISLIGNLSAWLSAFSIAILAIMYIIDIMGRFFISQQMKGTYEVAQFLLCIVTFSAFIYTQVSRRHIHVGILIMHFPPRLKYFVTSLNFVITSIICCFITYAIWDLGLLSVARSKHSQVLEIPFAPLYFFSSMLMALLALTLLTDAIRCILAFLGDDEAKESIDKVYA